MAKEPITYRIARVVVTATLRFYFRRIEVSAFKEIPKGPVIFAANHPQSITDTLVLGYAVGRMLHYIAHSGLFKNGLKAWFLRSCGVIPVYRPTDQEAGSRDNLEMFSACRAVLEEGGAIGIFPEGTSQVTPKVQPFKTGTARIALESESKHGFNLGVTIVPVGLSFESRRRFRSRVLVTFGQPVHMKVYKDAYARDSYETVHQLTHELEQRTRDLVLDIREASLADFVTRLERFYHDDLIQDPRIQLTSESDFENRQILIREIAKAVEHYRQKEPMLVEHLRVLLSAYTRRLSVFRLSDQQLRDYQAQSVPGTLGKLTAFAALGLPVAAYGLLFNIIPYKATGWVAKRLSPDGTKFHFFQLAVGAVFYLLYYPLLAYLVAQKVGVVWAGVWLLSLIPTGLFARWYAHQVTQQRGRLRVAFINATQKARLQSLRNARSELLAELETALERYLRYRQGT
ncbi:MAG: hypothetical protein HKN21_17685 [Candidatus Eisenbacteria bacterium]|uniref:Phospholipid/glycerol acyltransferase domain-containing protein n=1 Tax=Eiseniibacteriota bacterium TaxID=2212470 RepID=A0A7Y2EB71_UNCEI|nr:hypothetical protein [Candidatus Eisenbacteria bacterium]